MNQHFRHALAAFLTVALAASATAQEIKISHQFKANTDGRDKATRVFVEAVNKTVKLKAFRLAS